jgi:hypothetical protein
MKRTGIMVVLATTLVCGLVAAARAEGDQNRENHRNQWRGEKTAPGADRLQQRGRDRDRGGRDRDRARDGSCCIEAGDQARDRDQDRDRLQDGSCKE